MCLALAHRDESKVSRMRNGDDPPALSNWAVETRPGDQHAGPTSSPRKPQG